MFSRPISSLLGLVALLCTIFNSKFTANAQFHPTEPAQYQRLPPLREQATLLESWRQERLDALPALMQEHGVDVWLVRSSIYLIFIT